MKRIWREYIKGALEIGLFLILIAGICLYSALMQYPEAFAQ